jgi:23S rRNA pseudouridine1911/1915/1917 synthase
MEFSVEKSGERLDKFLAVHLKKFSRSRLQRLIKNGAVKVNGHFVIKQGLKLRSGDRLTVLEEKIISPNKEFAVEPEPDIPLNIVYEDADIAVINKPAGLLIHPTLSQPRHTLANALAARYPDIVKVGENPLRPGIVHRLDKDTSGLLVICKNQKAFLYMKDLFLKRAITKKYLALIEGVPKEKSGVIEYAIRPSKQFRLKKAAVQPFGEPKAKKSVRAAKTEYKVLKVLNSKFSLLETMPLTGRTHQIRIHLAAIGHPIAGDRLYGSKTKTKRQFLHAYYLKFTAPSGTPLALEIGLPEDLQKILAQLEK